MTRSRSRAFTIVEVAVATTVAVAVTAGGLAAITSSVRASQSSLLAEGIADAIVRVRQRAMDEQRCYLFRTNQGVSQLMQAAPGPDPGDPTCPGTIGANAEVFFDYTGFGDINLLRDCASGGNVSGSWFILPDGTMNLTGTQVPGGCAGANPANHGAVKDGAIFIDLVRFNLLTGQVHVVGDTDIEEIGEVGTHFNDYGALF